MRPPYVQSVCVGSMLAAGTLLALAVADPAGAKPDEPGARAEQPAKAPGGEPKQRLTQAPVPQPDAALRPAPEERRDIGTSPLRWLRYSSERFRTLMRMLTARSVRHQAKRTAEAGAAAEAKREPKTSTSQGTRRTADAQPSGGGKAEVEPAEAAAKAKREAEIGAAEEARGTKHPKRVAATERDTGTNPAEKARRAERAEEKAVGEAKQIDEEAATARARQPADAEEPAPVHEPPQRAAPCRKAGARVKGAGWYIVQVGDSLWRIARAHYGYGRAYRRIYAVNRRTIRDPHRIYPCQRIYIPRRRFGAVPVRVLAIGLPRLLQAQSARGLNG